MRASARPRWQGGLEDDVPFSSRGFARVLRRRIGAQHGGDRWTDYQHISDSTYLTCLGGRRAAYGRTTGPRATNGRTGGREPPPSGRVRDGRRAAVHRNSHPGGQRREPGERRGPSPSRGGRRGLDRGSQLLRRQPGRPRRLRRARIPGQALRRSSPRAPIGRTPRRKRWPSSQSRGAGRRRRASISGRGP